MLYTQLLTNAEQLITENVSVATCVHAHISILRWNMWVESPEEDIKRPVDGLALCRPQEIEATVYMRISKNHNSLGCEQPLGLDVNRSCTCR